MSMSDVILNSIISQFEDPKFKNIMYNKIIDPINQEIKFYHHILLTSYILILMLLIYIIYLIIYKK